MLPFGLVAYDLSALNTTFDVKIVGFEEQYIQLVTCGGGYRIIDGNHWSFIKKALRQP